MNVIKPILKKEIIIPSQLLDQFEKDKYLSTAFSALILEKKRIFRIYYRGKEDETKQKRIKKNKPDDKRWYRLK